MKKLHANHDVNVPMITNMIQLDETQLNSGLQRYRDDHEWEASNEVTVA